MKRFSFRLQRLMDIILQQLEQKRMEMATIQLKLDQKIREVHQQQKEINTHEHTLSLNMQNSSLSPTEFVLWENFIDFQYVVLGDLYKAQALIEQQLRKATDEFVEIDRNRKKLETLKEKQYQRYIEEFERIERSIMDDIGNRQFIEKQNGGGTPWLTESGKT